jgi:hypothetical protein
MRAYDVVRGTRLLRAHVLECGEGCDGQVAALTYVPVNVATLREVMEGPKAGRRKLR